MRFIYTKNAPDRNPVRGVIILLVPRTGLEPVRPCGQRILSPSCLPIPPPRHHVRPKIAKGRNDVKFDLKKWGEQPIKSEKPIPCLQRDVQLKLIGSCHTLKKKIGQSHKRLTDSFFGGAGRIRTAGESFAGSCLTTWPRRQNT